MNTFVGFMVIVRLLTHPPIHCIYSAELTITCSKAFSIGPIRIRFLHLAVWDPLISISLSVGCKGVVPDKWLNAMADLGTSCVVSIQEVLPVVSGYGDNDMG
jgi:hypothetical protein